MEYIDPKELLTTGLFVREPVNDLSKTLNENSSKRIILDGGRGTGKSTVLYNMENRGVAAEDPIICTRFDSVVNFAIKPSEMFNEVFFEHFYELNFSCTLLNFIKKNYSLTYEKYFKDIEALLKSITEEFNRNYKNARYDEQLLLNRYLRSTEISSEILRRLRKYLNLSSFNLAIDRFDWTNGRSPYVQQLLTKYFDMFDKTIITTDDESLTDENNKKNLERKGYSFVTADYGKDLEVVKDIIKRRVQLYNIKADRKFDVDILTNKIYEDLINKTNGDISSIIASVREAISLWNWKDGVCDISELFDRAIEERLEYTRQLKKVSLPPRLYL